MVQAVVVIGGGALSTRALEAIRDDAVIIDHLGDIYLRLGQPEKARALWRKSLQLDADNKTVARKLQDGR